MNCDIRRKIFLSGASFIETVCGVLRKVEEYLRMMNWESCETIEREREKWLKTTNEEKEKTSGGLK